MTICKAVDFLPVVRDVVVGGDGLPPLDPTAAAPRSFPVVGSLVKFGEFHMVNLSRIELQI